jgi:hypothetical protein
MISSDKKTIESTFQIRCHPDPGRSKMIERIKRESVSRRRMFSLLGVAVALGLAVPPTDAEAQTSGMKRRQERVQRRYERRGGQPAQNAPAQTTPAQNAPVPSQPAQKQ